MNDAKPLTGTQIDLLRALSEDCQRITRTRSGNVIAHGRTYAIESLRALRDCRFAKHGGDCGARIAGTAHITPAGRKFVEQLDAAL